MVWAEAPRHSTVMGEGSAVKGFAKLAGESFQRLCFHDTSTRRSASPGARNRQRNRGAWTAGRRPSRNGEEAAATLIARSSSSMSNGFGTTIANPAARLRSLLLIWASCVACASALNMMTGTDGFSAVIQAASSHDVP